MAGGTAFGPKHVAAAIARLPSLATKELEALLARATSAQLDDLATACRDELSVRPVELSAEAAVAHQRMAEQVRDMSLAEAVRHAFTKVRPPNEDELRFLRWVASNPGGTFKEAEKLHGKGDLGLVIGHIVYDRFGCFRQFMSDQSDQSSVLLIKERSGPSVRYTLRPEVAAALADVEAI